MVDDWNEQRNLVLTTLDRFDKTLTRLEEGIDMLRQDMAIKHDLAELKNDYAGMTTKVYTMAENLAIVQTKLAIYVAIATFCASTVGAVLGAVVTQYIGGVA